MTENIATNVDISAGQWVHARECQTVRRRWENRPRRGLRGGLRRLSQRPWGFKRPDWIPMRSFFGLARERRFRGRFVQADLAEQLPFADASFDTTICLEVLEQTGR